MRTPGQIIRLMALFWMILLSAAGPAFVLVLIVPIIWTLRSLRRVHRCQKAQQRELERKIAMARYAKRMKAWG